MTTPLKNYAKFLEQLKQKISSARLQAARSVNRELILLYHHIGSEILKQQKQKGWGAKVIDRLSKDLSEEFSEMKGLSVRNLKYMRRFAEEYPDLEFVQEALAQLTWYHNTTLLEKIKNKQTRIFYIKKAAENGWSRNVMLMHIETNLHKRQGQAITNFQQRLPNLQSDLAHYTLKDPYIFDFLTLSENANEKEIENALIHHMEKFLLELGEGFAFVSRQYHLQIADNDFYIDLLFYHIKLKCYVVVELKAGEFKPEYAGKMNFYLSAIDDLLKLPEDNPSIGLILCRKKNKILAEYALRDVNKPIGLSQYHLTKKLPKNIKDFLPSIAELEKELGGKNKK